MRIFLLFLLMLTLPLRSGMGDAMAAAGPHHGSTQHQQQEQVGLLAAVTHGLEDCAGHGPAQGTAPPGSAAAKASDSGHTAYSPFAAVAPNDVRAAEATCDACSACQTCHAVGLSFAQAELASLPAAHAQPTALSISFASAPAVRDQKPPIS